jgi:hypothetical protein
MKTVAIETETRRLSELLRKNGTEVIYLTRNGRAKYALVPLDEGDEEALAIRRNAQLMQYLAKASKAARKGPLKSLEEIERKVGLKKRAPSKSS